MVDHVFNRPDGDCVRAADVNDPSQRRSEHDGSCALWHRIILDHHRRIHELYKPQRRPPMANIHAAAKFTEIGLCRNLGDHIFLCELHKTLSLYIIGTGHVHERKNLTIPAGACGDCSLRGGRCG